MSPTTAGLSAILAAPGGPQQTLVDDSNVVALLKAVVHVIEDQERALAAQAGELASCRRLLDVGSRLAVHFSSGTSPDAPALRARSAFGAEHAARLETEIDAVLKTLPDLTAFVLPYGDAATVALHVARTTCRRAERTVVAFLGSAPADPMDKAVLRYLNRLSDYLYVCARAACVRAGLPEMYYSAPDDAPDVRKVASTSASRRVGGRRWPLVAAVAAVLAAAAGWGLGPEAAVGLWRGLGGGAAPSMANSMATKPKKGRRAKR